MVNFVLHCLVAASMIVNSGASERFAVHSGVVQSLSRHCLVSKTPQRALLKRSFSLACAIASAFWSRSIGCLQLFPTSAQASRQDTMPTAQTGASGLKTH